MEQKKILISVVIPVKNGDIWLENCIRSIMKQTLFAKTEIIAIDSGSTDRSLDILKMFPVKIVHITPEEFNHGLTRNYAVNYCQGQYIVMTVQDARAVDEFWLQNLLNGFTSSNVAGVCGQQVVPHERDKNPVEWFRPYTPPSMYSFCFPSADEFQKLSASEKKHCCAWDNVTAMYRKEVLQSIPFKKISYGEDHVWAKDALANGYEIVYNTAARVYHYHYENWQFSFKRTLTVLYLRYKHFGYIYPKPQKTIREMLSTVKVIWISKPLSISEKLKWLSYNLNQWNAMKEAHAVFMNALKNGEDALDKEHDKICGKPPVPLKMKTNDKSSTAKTIVL